ncbi:MAG: hypothetical protein ABSF22_06470 [Bryobacteraceae bacterium]
MVNFLQEDVLFNDGLIEFRYFGAYLQIGIFQVPVGFGEFSLKDGGVAFLEIRLTERAQQN